MYTNVCKEVEFNYLTATFDNLLVYNAPSVPQQRKMGKSTGDKIWYVSEVYIQQIQWDSILESCFVSYVIVKSPSKPYIVVHSHTALLHR